MTTTEPECLSGRKAYNPRIGDLVCATSNHRLFPELKNPKSTLQRWLNGESRTAVGTESAIRTELGLYPVIAELRRRVRVMQAVMCLLVALRATGVVA